MYEFLERVKTFIPGLFNSAKELFFVLTEEGTLGTFIADSLPDGLEFVGALAETLLNVSVVEVLFYWGATYVAIAVAKWFIGIFT